MSEEGLFRAILAIGFLAVLAIVIPHRVKSATAKEPLDRRQEGLFILLTLRPAGLAWFVLIAGVFVFTLLAIRSGTEEAQLAARFGEPYLAYRERTGTFLPRWRS